MKPVEQQYPHKAARAGAENTYTNLTQPTDVAADWAGFDFITSSLANHALVGIIRAFLIL